MDSGYKHTLGNQGAAVWDSYSGINAGANRVIPGPFPRNAPLLKSFGHSTYTSGIRKLLQATTADFAVYALMRLTPFGESANAKVMTGSASPFLMLTDGSIAANDLAANQECVGLSHQSYGSAYIGASYWWSNSSTYNVRINNFSDFYDGEWHVLEWRYKADNSTGICQLYFDGELVIDVTGADTILGTSPPTFTGLTHLVVGSVNTYGYFDYATLIVYDSSTSPTGCLTTSDFPLGITAVQRLVPNAAGNYAQFDAGNFTNNYQAHQGTTRSVYCSPVTTSTADSIDTYGFENLEGSPTIKALQMSAYCESFGNNAAYIKGVARSSGTDGTSNSVLVPGPLRRIEMEIPYDPNTSTDWTSSGVNAAEFGIKYTTS